MNIAPKQTAMQLRLVLKTGARAGMSANVPHGVFMIGRSRKCHIRSWHKSVSRQHCVLINTLPEPRIVDLGSSGGTYVNGVRAIKGVPVRLTGGSTFAIGKVVFAIEEISSTPADQLLNLDKPAAAEEWDLQPAASISLETIGSDLPGQEDSSSGEHAFEVHLDSSLEEDDIAGWLRASDEAEQRERIAALREQLKTGRLDEGSALDDVAEPQPVAPAPQPANGEKSPHRPTPAAQKKNASLPRWNPFSSLANLTANAGEWWQWVAAGVVLIGVILWIAWAYYYFIHGGPPPEVIEGI